MACPPSAPGRWIALPGLWMLAEADRGRWPFGGVPVSRLAMGQVDSPLVHVARGGGPLLLELVTVVGGRRGPAPAGCPPSPPWRGAPRGRRRPPATGAVRARAPPSRSCSRSW